MASRSKTRRRAPLMESGTEAALRRRGTELVGLVLLGLAALAATMILTYSPDDPSLFSATDEAPRNALGLVGASLADPLHRALGWAAYGISAILGVWGLRFLSTPARAGRCAAPSSRPSRSSSPRASPPPTSRRRAGATSTASAVSSATPSSGRCCRCRPSTLPLTFRIATLALAALFVLASGYVLGVTWAEARGFLRFLGQGTVVLYSGAHSLTGKAVSTAARRRQGRRPRRARPRRREPCPPHRPRARARHVARRARRGRRRARLRPPATTRA